MILFLLLWSITSVFAEPVRKCAPLKSITLTVLNKISAKKESIEIPFEHELRLDGLKIYPTSCQAIKKTTKKDPAYKVSLKIWKGSSQNFESTPFFEGMIGNCPDETTDYFDHPVYSVFLDKCTFLPVS